MESFPKLKNTKDNSTILIQTPTFSIGRSLSCDQIFQSLGISRFHCVLKKNINKWSITDRSTNGTFVNTTHLKFNDSLELRNGDIIKCGSEELIFEEPEANELEVVEVIEEFAKPFGPECVQVEVENLGSEIELFESDSKSDLNSAVKTEPEPSSIENPPAPSTSNLTTHMDNELTCTICSELFIKAVTLNCSHSFCKYCIEHWRRKKSTCPICRAHISSLNPTLVLDNFIEKFLIEQTEDVRLLRDSVVKQREEAALPQSSNKLELDDIIQINSDSEMEYDDYSYSEDEDDLDDDDVYYYRSSRRPYYGGYGRCFSCGQEGHWANTCPFRRRR